MEIICQFFAIIIALFLVAAGTTVFVIFGYTVFDVVKKINKKVCVRQPGSKQSFNNIVQLDRYRPKESPIGDFVLENFTVGFEPMKETIRKIERRHPGAFMIRVDMIEPGAVHYSVLTNKKGERS